jgi:CBS-domain-containing membrane protein
MHELELRGPRGMRAPDALAAIRERRFKALPVVDRARRVIGIITRPVSIPMFGERHLVEHA